jgi:hypothetical protein
MCAQLRYKAALITFLLAAPAVAQAERVAGAQLPDDSRRIEANRYRIEKNYADTLKYFRTVYPPGKYPRRPIVNQPGIKAVHIENPAPRPGGWDGLNVYELRGETRVFVLVAPEKEQEKEKSGRRK